MSEQETEHDQGESDADNREAAGRYAANLSRLIARVREQFRAPEMVFVYGYVEEPNNKRWGWIPLGALKPKN